MLHNNPIDRHAPIPPQLFINNRKKLTQKLLPNSLVVIHANDIFPTGADGIMPFRQHTDLFYLSGINQEETILLLYPEATEQAHKEILFIKKTTPEIAVWEGQKYTKSQAQASTGITHIHWLEKFPTLFHALMRKADHLYLYTDEHTNHDMHVQTRNKRFVHWCKTHYPLHSYKRLAPLMQDLRMIKSQIEIDLIRKAYTITEKGFRQMIPLLKPGIMEYQLEASLIKTFTEEASLGFAYTPIIASGANSCILHYIANNQACKAGDLVLLDIGALYGNYHADLTRVLPVSGQFTPRQKKVYQAVLHVFKHAKKLLVPGNNFTTYTKEIGEIMTKELLDLGLLTKQEVKDQDPLQPAYKKYFMHGTSHHLGLSTHDVADKSKPFAPGMVLTIEPGIYLPEEGFGIRLENGVVIRENRVEDLVPNLPLEPEAIESLMHKK
ncbi:MAG: aminopeptidase P N-terminal domain-containing protein [Bacteroidota bacterium]